MSHEPANKDDSVMFHTNQGALLQMNTICMFFKYAYKSIRNETVCLVQFGPINSSMISLLIISQAVEQFRTL